MPRSSVIALCNTSFETQEVLRELLQELGFQPLTCHVDDIRRGKHDFLRFLEQQDPGVVLWDIAPPYAENWTFFQLVRSSHAMDGRKIVVSTTNKEMLDRIVGMDTHAHVVVGKPFDMEELVRSIVVESGEEAPLERLRELVTNKTTVQ